MLKPEQPTQVRLVNGVPAGSFEAQLGDLDAFEAHVEEVLKAAKAYAGDDPKKMRKFEKAYKKGIILRLE